MKRRRQGPSRPVRCLVITVPASDPAEEERARDELAAAFHAFVEGALADRDGAAGSDRIDAGPQSGGPRPTR